MFELIPLTKTTGVVTVLAVAADAINLPRLAMPLQYGAFGLCAVLVWAILKLLDAFKSVLADHKSERKELVKDIQKKDAKLLEVITKNDKTLNRLAEALEDKPCLAMDQRAEVAG